MHNQEQRFIFLTLTVKNIELLGIDATIKQMNKAWKVLWQKYLSKQFNGFVKILEFTFPNGNDAHPHFHILLTTDKKYFYKKNDKYLTTQDISVLWSKALKVDYMPVVDIRIIKPKKVKGGYISKEAIPAVVAEMTKYPMKDTDYNKLSPDMMSLLHKQLYKKRLISTGGNLKMSVNKVEEEVSINEVDDIKIDAWQKIAYFVMNFIAGNYIIVDSGYYNSNKVIVNSEYSNSDVVIVSSEYFNSS